MRETDRDRPSSPALFCSVQKAAVVENSSLIMGLASGSGGRSPVGIGGGGGGGGGSSERITFRSFLPLGGAAVGWEDGRTAKKERERERTKLSTPDKNVERKERRLASNTNTTYSYCRLEAWTGGRRKAGRKGGRRGRWREGDRQTGRRHGQRTTRTTTTKFAKRQIDFGAMKCRRFRQTTDGCPLSLNESRTSSACATNELFYAGVMHKFGDTRMALGSVWV